MEQEAGFVVYSPLAIRYSPFMKRPKFAPDRVVFP